MEYGISITQNIVFVKIIVSRWLRLPEWHGSWVIYAFPRSTEYGSNDPWRSAWKQWPLLWSNCDRFRQVSSASINRPDPVEDAEPQFSRPDWELISFWIQMFHEFEYVLADHFGLSQFHMRDGFTNYRVLMKIIAKDITFKMLLQHLVQGQVTVGVKYEPNMWNSPYATLIPFWKLSPTTIPEGRYYITCILF